MGATDSGGIHDGNVGSRPEAPRCYEEHVALCEVLHSLHGRVVTLEQRVTILEGMIKEQHGEQEVSPVLSEEDQG